MKHLLNKYYHEDGPIDGWVEYGYREVFKIYNFIALVETGHTKEARLLSESISQEKIAFYFRKTFWRLYLKSYVKIISDADDKKAIQNQIATLEGFLYPTTIKKTSQA